MSISEIMSDDVVRIDATASLEDALSIMADNGIRHLPVTSDGELVGILSDRDLAAFRNGNGISAESPSASALMNGDIISASTESTLEETLDQLLEFKVGALPVVSAEDEQLVGIVSYVDILAQRGEEIADLQIADLMHRNPISVQESTPRSKLYALMEKLELRHLPILSGNKLVGMVSDRDLATDDDSQAPASSIMTREVLTVRETESASSAMDIICEERVGAVPVLGTSGEVVGIVSYLDLLKALREAL